MSKKSKRVNGDGGTNTPMAYSRQFRNNAAITNQGVIERFYMKMLASWAMSRFEWVNMPSSIDTRFIESCLHYEGSVLFYYDDRFDRHLVTRYVGNGTVNLYDNPTRFTTVARASYSSVTLSSKEAVPIWNNDIRTASNDLVYVYARRLANLDVSLEINARNMRHNKIITCEDSQRMTYMQLLRKVEEGQPVIFGTDSLDLSALNVIDVSTDPNNLAALRLEKNQVWGEAMTMLGITNVNTDKKERLVAGEAMASNGQVISARNSCMSVRKRACEQINEMFGLDLDVRWALDEDTVPDFDMGTFSEAVGGAH